MNNWKYHLTIKANNNELNTVIQRAKGNGYMAAI